MTDAVAPFARYIPTPEVRPVRLTPVPAEAGTDTIDLLAALQVQVRGGSPAQRAERNSRTVFSRTLDPEDRTPAAPLRVSRGTPGPTGRSWV
jgi:hypothetical protein